MSVSQRKAMDSDVPRRQAFKLLAVALAAAGLAACGMKGDPEVPAEAARRVPRQYPAK